MRDSDVSDHGVLALCAVDLCDRLFIKGINATGAEMPFRRVKRSGYCRVLGCYGVDEFVSTKPIRIIR